MLDLFEIDLMRLLEKDGPLNQEQLLVHYPPGGLGAMAAFYLKKLMFMDLVLIENDQASITAAGLRQLRVSIH